ncbi:hypothetical protein [Streptomyces sp. NBC_01565]|uniref:hypothetical protein n=1 Tax=unclassified Streptomyces TaxID=2593676 RepID=UPI00224FC4DD|nr:hypothetical protein [Streptomyces sp. NBC_01565]MCX4546100.1 hypothetical protein [Streptomyces sp. NBC_01565]
MRLLHRAAVPLAALLVLAVPQSADAARGKFTFRYEVGGHARTGALHNPPDGACIDATGVLGGSGRAGSARNTTDRTATLYMSIDCEDDGTVLAPGATHPKQFKTVRFG